MSENTALDLAPAATGADTVRQSIQNLKHNNVAVYSSFTGDTFEDKKAVVAALSNALPLSEHIGEVINLTNIIIQAVEMEDETTKKMVTVPRLILVGDNDESYYAISNGLYKSIENIVGIMGQPETWGQPLPIAVDRIKGGKGFFYTARIA